MNGNKIESVNFYLSDESKKGACSALVFLDKYITKKKYEYFAKHAAPLKTIFIWGDRGSGDQWNADWLAHSAELSFIHGVQLLTGTLPGGHNKWLHDAFGNVAKSAALRALLGDIVKFGPDDSPSKVLCDWLNKEYGFSLDGTKKYEYIYVPADEVPPRYSNIQTLKIGPQGQGVKSFHTARADTDGGLYFRRLSCFCDECIEGEFKINCALSDKVGEWMKCNKIKPKKQKPKQVQKKDKRLYEYDETNEELRKLFTNKDGKYVEASKWLKPDLLTLCKGKRICTKSRNGDGKLVADKKDALIKKLVSHTLAWSDFHSRTSNIHSNQSPNQSPNHRHIRNRNAQNIHPPRTLHDHNHNIRDERNHNVRHGRNHNVQRTQYQNNHHIRHGNMHNIRPQNNQRKRHQPHIYLQPPKRHRQNNTVSLIPPPPQPPSLPYIPPPQPPPNNNGNSSVPPPPPLPF